MWKRRVCPEAQHHPILSPAALILGLASCFIILSRALFPAILGLPLEQFFKDPPTTSDRVCHCYTSLLKLNSVLSERLSPGTSLDVQWLRIHLPMQGTQVWSLVWEDPTSHRATKPVHPDHWSVRTLERLLHSKGSRHSEKPGAAVEEPLQVTLQTAGVRQWRPSAAKRNQLVKILKDWVQQKKKDISFLFIFILLTFCTWFC